MTISTLQKSSIAKALVAALLMTIVLGVFLFGPQRAHAQSAQIFENGIPMPNIDFGNNFPFGYGGGPRVPTPPDTSRIINRIFVRVNALFDRLLNR